MSRDELAVMPGDKCILQLRGVRSFYSDKFDITKHRRYRELSDFDKNNEFHIEEYLEHRLVLPQEEAFEFYEYELSPEEIEGGGKGGDGRCRMILHMLSPEEFVSI